MTIFYEESHVTYESNAHDYEGAAYLGGAKKGVKKRRGKLVDVSEQFREAKKKIAEANQAHEKAHALQEISQKISASLSPERKRELLQKLEPFNRGSVDKIHTISFSQIAKQDRLLDDVLSSIKDILRSQDIVNKEKSRKRLQEQEELAILLLI